MSSTDYPYSNLFEKPKGIYALSHSVGPLCKVARKALDTDYLNDWANLGGDAWPKWLTQIDGFSAQVAGLINANPQAICPQENLASGFYTFISAIAKRPEHKHQDTIVMHKDAFASMGFVVQGLANTYKLKLVLLNDAPNDIDAWYNAFEDNSVLACLVTHVHSNTSVKSKVREICAIARQFEAYSMVDIAQSVGIVPVDVKTWQVDAVFGSCVKWLCGGPGAGFMYVREDLITRLEPDPIGWFSHENPFEFDINRYVPASDAKRFWGGTPSVAPYVMASSAIECLQDIGLTKIIEHNYMLKHLIVERLTEYGVLTEKVDVDSLGGSLCLAANHAAKTQEKLAKHAVAHDMRSDIFRISLHLINTVEEAEVVASCFDT